MIIEQRTEAGIPVLHLHGRLDGITSYDLQRELEKLWATGQYRVILDCSGLRYASSAGLQIFIIAGKIVEAHKGRMVFCGLGPWMGELFALTQFDSIFAVYGSAAEAAASFKE